MNAHANNACDAACKQVLSEKQILSHILHDHVDEFKNANPQEIARCCFEGNPRVGTDPVGRSDSVRALTNEDSTPLEGEVFFDVRFEAYAPDSLDAADRDIVSVEVDIEAQNKFSPGYPLLKRGVFYAGRLLSLQGGKVVTHSHYERLRKVVSVWVCAHPPKEYAGTVTSFSLQPSQLVGHAKFEADHSNLVQVLLICLNDKNPGSSEGALGMLEVLFSTRIDARRKIYMLKAGYGIMVSEQFDKKVSDMCNLSVGYFEEGVEEGRKEGREEERKVFLEVAASMVRDGALTLDEVLRRFGCSEDELRAIL